jgi:dTDP-4-dehydrorhamnose reductase
MADTLLLTGSDGYVGQRLAQRLGRHVDVIGISRRGTHGLACELLDEGALDEVARTVSPRWIVHAAGNKNIGACEKTPMLAYDANVRTASNVLRAWPDVPMLYLSTDYVFAGTHGHSRETSPVAPRTTYGRSKLCAEVTGALTAPGRFTSVRVSAVYDASAAFLAYLDGELRESRPVECFSDSYYSPTYIDDLASAVLSLLGCAERPDVVHIAGARTSRFDFARQFADAFGYDPSLVRPVTLESANTALYPDLSLATHLAADAIGFAPTAHETALRQIARGVSHGNAHAVSTVLRFEGSHARSDQRRGVGGDQLPRNHRVLHAWGTLSS